MSLPVSFTFTTPPVPEGFASWTAYYAKNGWNSGVAGGLPNPGIAMDAALGAASPPPPPSTRPAPDVLGADAPAPAPASGAPRPWAKWAAIAAASIGVVLLLRVLVLRSRK